MKRELFLIIILLFFSETTMAQLSFMGGGNYSNVMNHKILDNPEFNSSYHIGIAANAYPFRKMPNLSFQTEFLYNKKGYHQHFEKSYIFRFNYFSMPLLVRYSPVKDLTIDTGIELSRILYTNILYGRHTYNNFDTGLILGLTYFDNHLINLYARVIYGLVPMLDYFTFDKLGNFTGEIHDLRNICFSLGIKINLYHEKIILY